MGQHPDTMGMGCCLLDLLVFFSGPSTWAAVGCGVFRLTLTIRRNRRAPGLWLYCRFFIRICLAITCACESQSLWILFVSPHWASQVAPMVKNLPATAGDLRDSSSIPGSGRSPWRTAWPPTPNILAWKIPWTEEPGGLQSIGSQELDTTEVT